MWCWINRSGASLRRQRSTFRGAANFQCFVSYHRVISVRWERKQFCTGDVLYHGFGDEFSSRLDTKSGRPEDSSENSKMPPVANVQKMFGMTHKTYTRPSPIITKEWNDTLRTVSICHAEYLCNNSNVGASNSAGLDKCSHLVLSRSHVNFRCRNWRHIDVKWYRK